MAKTKQLTPQEITQAFLNLSPKEQIDTYAELKKLMDEKEDERKQLSNDYQKLNNGK